MRTTISLAVAFTAVASAALTACSTSGSGSPQTEPQTSSSTTTSTAAPPSTSASTPAPQTSSAADPVSSGDSPPSGSAEVSFGQSSLVALDDFSSGKTHPIKLTLSLRPGALSDLKGFQLDAQTKRSTPFYLSIQVTNVGTTPIDTSGFAGLLTVDDGAGDEVNSLTLLGDFPKCEGAIPDKLAPGKAGQECDVYTAPKGQQVGSASIDNGTGTATITWK